MTHYTYDFFRTWRLLSGAFLLWAVLLVFARPAQAQLRVDISGTGAQQYPIAVADFSGDDMGRMIGEVIRANLTRTGQFRLVSASDAAPDYDTDINYDEWRTRGADTMTYGTLARSPDGRYDVRFRLADTVFKSQLDSAVFAGSEAELRRIAHQISDRIYEKITGIRGVFSTRLAYVLKRGDTYELQIADADGQNPRVILRSRAPIISPAWSPDGGSLAYVSFQTGKPVVYVQHLSGKQIAVANYRGNNSAPAWSPDASQLAVALTRDGLSQIYTVNAMGGGLKRLTRSSLIDTEPFYSPDGAWIYFTSDRGGSPQIYRMSAAGGEAQRITFNSAYSISPRVSPDGATLLYVSRVEGRFRIAAMNLANGTEFALTNGPNDHSPSFAPNGMQVLYSTVQNGRSVLAGVSSDGRVRQTLSILDGEIREPTWGPFAQ